MKTRIYKGTNGWKGESITEADANGNAWDITTSKGRNGVECTAIQGKLSESGMFSFEMFGAKRMQLASEEGQCNEAKVKRVHEAGLAAFALQMAELSKTAKPLYVLGVGQIVFTDMINSDSGVKRVICEVLEPGRFKTVSIDGKQFRTEEHIKPYSEKFGIGTYYNECEIMELSEVNKLVEQATEYIAKQAEAAKKASEAAKIEETRKIEEGAKIIQALPKDANFIIVAELREDASDMHNDHFSYKTVKTVFLSFSNHKRDLFAEMRKAAAKFEETQIYAIEPTKPEDANEFWTAPDEHREKYSMGAGYYLGESKYHGWIISKQSLNTTGSGYGISLKTLQIAAAEGRFYCNVEDAQKEEAKNYEPIEVKAGEVQIIEYSEKAIAVIGDTKPIKEKLKELGGKFNFRLSCGAGWIFPKTKLEAVKIALG